MPHRAGAWPGVMALLIGALTLAPPARAQQAPASSRARLLESVGRHAVSSADRNRIITDSRSRNIPLQRLAVRAIGRLEDPSLAKYVYPRLDSYVPEVRMEAANALGQIAQAQLSADALDQITSQLLDRLDAEHESEVVGVICRTLGRLPYTDAAQVQRIEARMLTALHDQPTLEVALGVASGVETLTRTRGTLSPPSPPVIAALRTLTDASDDSVSGDGARVRRLALLALTEAKAVDAVTLRRTFHDPDAQVRREAAAAADASDLPETAALVAGALRDPAPMVRYEALRTYGRRQHADGCAPTITALTDPDVHVDLLAIDLLGDPCTSSTTGADGIDDLARIAGSYHGGTTSGVTTTALESQAAGHARTSDSGLRTSDLTSVTWHRPAHALVSLAKRAPDRARPLLGRFAVGEPWEVRMYAARAAGVLHDQETLQHLALDADDNVRNAALDALKDVSGHGADPLYLLALKQPDYQLVRTAALALAGTFRKDDAVPALIEALNRITKERKETSRDVRLALLDRIGELGSKAEAARLRPFLADFDPAVADRAATVLSTWTGQAVRPTTRTFADTIDIDPRALTRLGSPRAHVTMADGRSFDIALLTGEAPATVLRFVQLATDGYYNGLTFHRIVPNFVIQGGSPRANEYAGDAGPFMQNEVGLWPHVRGAVGISTRGRDTGDGQFFIDLVDNPRLNGDYTVFGQVLTGMDVVDQVVEGDVIRSITILP
ncbi:MAG TPA: peptidylprolyl isomerase [Vicinamibacterales bacterium]